MVLKMASVTPILNNSLETAFRGATQGVAHAIDYTRGSPDLLVVLGIVAGAIIIIAVFASKK